MEVSGSKSVANCGRSTYKFSMCFDRCLPFQGDLKNPSITLFWARTIHLRRQFRPACFRVDKRWHTAYRSTLSRGTVGVDLLPGAFVADLGTLERRKSRALLSKLVKGLADEYGPRKSAVNPNRFATALNDGSDTRIFLDVRRVRPAGSIRTKQNQETRS